MMKKIYLGFLMLLMMVVTLSAVPLKAASPVGTSFNFSVNTKVGTNAPVVTDLGSRDYASTVSFDAGTANPDYDFVTYIVNDKVESGLPANHTFIVTSDLTVTALYKPDGTIAVAFMDANQDLLSTAFVASGGEVTPPDISGLAKPGYEVSATPWSGAYNNPTEDTIVWVQYTSTVAETYTLTVNNGTGGGTYDYNEVATVVASGTGTFQYWYMNGNIVSLRQTYSFTVVDDTEITAVYTGEAAGTNPDSLFITLSNPYAINTGYNTYVGQFYLPDGNDMVEYGILASDTPGDFTLDTDGITKIRSNKYNATTGEFVRSFADTYDKYLRAYMITTDGVDETVTYSFVNENLFISEYGEGSSNNKWIEIYNPNDYTVDLTNYELLLFTNGATSGGSSPNFTGVTISAKDVLVIYNSSSVSNVSDNGDISSGVTNFNGDDALALYKDGFIVDQFGTIGTDPGSEWTVGIDGTENHTITRKVAVTQPNPIWDTSEWDTFAIDYFDSIGIHNPQAPDSIEITGDTEVMEGLTITLSVTYPANTLEGVTWESSNTDVATVNGSGVVTGVSEGSVTITATSTENGSVTDTHSVTVTAPVTYSVTYMSEGVEFDQETGITPGATVSAPDPEPTKADHTFTGWFTAAEGGTQWNFAEDTVDVNTTLYARFVEGSVTYSSDLFISEYIEGSSSNKAIEIYNNTGSSVDLSVYTIRVYSNGSTTPTSITLSGTLAHGDTFVVANTSANATIKGLADLLSGSLSHNGDDAIALAKNGTNIDVIGQIGLDPGSAWSVSGVSTVNMTLTRKSSVTDGDTNGSDAFDPSVEWNAYPSDTTEYLGSHSIAPE